MRVERLIIGFMLMVSLKAVALTQPCDLFSMAYKDELPEHYCPCSYDSYTFSMPIDTILSEPVWFTATLDDLKQGLSAYWFSEDSVVMDVYALCMSTVPSFSMVIGPNRMYEMELEKINKKLDELGNAASFLTGLTPHIHVYTVHGGAGQVYCYPYDQGPHSTCDQTLEMRPGMTYVCSAEENVYRLPHAKIASSGQAFIQWKHRPKKTNRAFETAQVWLTIGACEGDTLGLATLSDSLHVYQPDSALLTAARNNEQDIWVHVKHAPGITGRVRYVNNPKYDTPLQAYIDSACAGKTIVVNERSYEADTNRIDTIWVGGDTLRTQPVQLSFPLTTVYDTVRVKDSELRRGYVHSSGVVLRQYGDTVFDIVGTNTCTVRYYVAVLHPMDTESVSSRPQARKQLINGQLYILIDERKYNVLGQQIAK